VSRAYDVAQIEISRPATKLALQWDRQILWLIAKKLRIPDIAPAVNKLASFLDCYCPEYWEAGIHIVHHSALSLAASFPLHSLATPIQTMPIAQPQAVPCPAPSPLGPVPSPAGAHANSEQSLIPLARNTNLEVM
jgi:hypothetical protein